MVKLTKIYTRGGDTGETSLGTGERVRKDDKRIDALETQIDELAIRTLALRQPMAEDLRSVFGLDEGEQRWQWQAQW